MDESPSVFVLSVRRTCVDGRNYLHSIWTESQISSEFVHIVLINISEFSGKQLVGFHRVPSICGCHGEARAEEIQI